MTTYYGVCGGCEVYEVPHLSLADAIKKLDRVRSLLGEKNAHIVRIDVSPVKDADIVRCPRWRECGVECGHHKPHEVWFSCRRGAIGNSGDVCPGCEPVGKGEQV